MAIGSTDVSASKTVAWINGNLIPYSQAAVPVWDLGLVAGAAVTEMARTYGHRVFRLEEHLDRFFGGISELQFPVPFGRDVLREAVQDVIALNLRELRPNQELGVVVFTTAGVNPTYLGGCTGRGTTGIHTFSLPFELWRDAFCSGVRLQIPGMRQIPAHCFPVHLKVRNRLHWWLADQEASRISPGSKALLLDQRENVTETATACFHAVIDGSIVTPTGQVLQSLSSRVTEELATAAGIPFYRRVLHESELQAASEAFLTSTPVGILPVRQIGHQPHGADAVRVTNLPGPQGPVFRTLVQAWSSLVKIPLPEQFAISNAIPDVSDTGIPASH